MKAQPVIADSSGYAECSVAKATHVKIKLPGPTGVLVLPVITSGSRKDTPFWTWNGDTENPTLRPSLLSKLEWKVPAVICHCFVNDGLVQFLTDSTHSLAGQTVPLIDLQGSDL